MIGDGDFWVSGFEGLRSTTARASGSAPARIGSAEQTLGREFGLVMVDERQGLHEG